LAFDPDWLLRPKGKGLMEVIFTKDDGVTIITTVKDLKALLRSTEKASKEVLRLAALGREVERMEPCTMLSRTDGDVDRMTNKVWRVDDWDGTSYSEEATPLAALRSARISKAKGVKK